MSKGTAKIKDPFNIIKRPILTEKVYSIREERNLVCFAVDRSANKIEIKKAVEDIFGVTVLDVNTANCRGRGRRVGTRFTKVPYWKKAYITLAEGDMIDFFEGV